MDPLLANLNERRRRDVIQYCIRVRHGNDVVGEYFYFEILWERKRFFTEFKLYSTTYKEYK